MKPSITKRCYNTMAGGRIGYCLAFLRTDYALAFDTHLPPFLLFIVFEIVNSSND